MRLDLYAQVVESADTVDLKSTGRNTVRVQVPSWAFKRKRGGKIESVKKAHPLGQEIKKVNSLKGTQIAK